MIKSQCIIPVISGNNISTKYYIKGMPFRNSKLSHKNYTKAFNGNVISDLFEFLYAEIFQVKKMHRRFNFGCKDMPGHDR